MASGQSRRDGDGEIRHVVVKSRDAGVEKSAPVADHGPAIRGGRGETAARPVGDPVLCDGAELCQQMVAGPAIDRSECIEGRALRRGVRQRPMGHYFALHHRRDTTAP